MNLRNLNVEELIRFVSQKGWERYRAKQLLSWLYKRPVDSFCDITNLPKEARKELAEECELYSLSFLDKLVSRDGTVKFVFKTADGDLVESVAIPDEDRLTLCISTQIGCRMGCAFCLTGFQGFKRNLSSAEIVEQVILAQKLLGRPITNIVVMGMGEPLDNMDNTLKALSLMTHRDAMGLSPRRIVVSTVGLLPQLEHFLKEAPRVALSVSLNAPSPEKRRAIMPVEKATGMLELVEFLAEAYKNRRKPVTFEYVMLKGFNDAIEDARHLAKLLKKFKRCKVNLIPFNPWPGAPFERPDAETVLSFQKVLIESGIPTFIRKSRGADILAACGQLRWSYKEKGSA